jgi:predicted RNA binding protein with dsRBD fold (UPF0201 family)
MQIHNSAYTLTFPRKQTRIRSSSIETQNSLKKMLDRADIPYINSDNNEIKINSKQPDTLQRLKLFLEKKHISDCETEQLAKMVRDDLKTASLIYRF